MCNSSNDGGVRRCSLQIFKKKPEHDEMLEVKRKCHNSLKLDDLFLDNKPLADDRSVAHFNLEDGTILETTSNPFWVTCLFIKQCEVFKEQKANPDDPHVQAWTNRSLARKKTLLSVLLNSKSEYRSQPKHFPTLDDLLYFLENLGKKGATMNPHYTQKDLRLMYEEYHAEDVGCSDDPIGAFIHRHAVRLGLREPDPLQYNNRLEEGRGRNQRAANLPVHNKTPPAGPARQQRAGAKNKTRICEDCEATEAEVYCEECQNATGGQGLALCGQCSHALHVGAARRRHVVTDIVQAPKSVKPYVPHAFKAPFSILVALLSGLSERPPKLSMTEDEVKERAQPLTDTDLQDKQNGRYVGGFECMENTLMLKGFVQREDSRNPTYALTQKGHELAEELFHFHQTVQRFLKSQGVPKISLKPNPVCGHRRICLIIDEQERDRHRLINILSQRNVDAQVRQLPAGDYLWILTPPFHDPQEKYEQRNPAQELVLPYLVERKSWEDLLDSIKTKRFHRQVNNMLGSGVPNLFYLMEGSVGCMKYKQTEAQQKRLQGEVENLLLRNGFYLNYTGSWFKSAVWLGWMTALISHAHNADSLLEECIPYTEYTRRTCRQPTVKTIAATDRRAGVCSVWTADQFTDLIFREEERRGSVVRQATQETHGQHNSRTVLVIQNLGTYNKKRQTLLNKCLLDVYGDLENMSDRVQGKLSACLQNMLHYDIMSYWQLHIQVMTNIYVVRTENDEDTRRIQDAIRNGNNSYHDILLGNPRQVGIHTTARGRGKQSMSNRTKKGTRNNSQESRSPPHTTWGRGRRLDEGDDDVYDDNEGRTGNVRDWGRGRILQEDESGTYIGRNHKQKKGKQTQRKKSDESDDIDQNLYATDSQTEDLMIQQAYALSMQQAGDFNEGSDDDNRLLEDHDVADYPVGENIEAVSLQDEESQLKLAMKLSLVSEKAKTDVNEENSRQNMEKMDTRAENGEEQFNFILKQSMEDLRNQQGTSKQNLARPQALLVDDDDMSDDDVNLSLALKQSLDESHIGRNPEHFVEHKRFDELDATHAGNENEELQKALKCSLEESNKQKQLTDHSVVERLNVPLSDSQDEELQYVLQLSKTDTGTKQDMSHEHSITVSKYGKEIIISSKVDRGDDVNLASGSGQAEISSLPHNISKRGIVAGEVNQVSSVTRTGSSCSGDSQDEELEMVLRMSKQEYAEMLSETSHPDAEPFSVDQIDTKQSQLLQSVGGTGSFSQPLVLEDSQELSNSGSEEEIFIELEATESKSCENDNGNLEISSFMSDERNSCTSFSDNSQNKIVDGVAAANLVNNVRSEMSNDDSCNEEGMYSSSRKEDKCQSPAGSRAVSSNSVVPDHLQNSYKGTNHNLAKEVDFNQKDIVTKETNNNIHFCDKCSQLTQKDAIQNQDMCKCIAGEKSSEMTVVPNLNLGVDSDCRSLNIENTKSCLEKCEPLKILESEIGMDRSLCTSNRDKLNCSPEKCQGEAISKQTPIKFPFSEIGDKNTCKSDEQDHSNVLVDDTQNLSDDEKDYSAKGSPIKETQCHQSFNMRQKLNFYDQKEDLSEDDTENDDNGIYVIPPSPEKQSPRIFTTQKVSLAITSRKAFSKQSECENIETQPVCEQTSEKDVCEQTSEKDVCEQTLEKDVCEQTLEKDVCEQTLEKDVFEQTLEKDVCEQTLEKDVCEQTLEKDSDVLCSMTDTTSSSSVMKSTTLQLGDGRSVQSESPSEEFIFSQSESQSQLLLQGCAWNEVLENNQSSDFKNENFYIANSLADKSELQTHLSAEIEDVGIKRRTSLEISVPSEKTVQVSEVLSNNTLAQMAGEKDGSRECFKNEKPLLVSSSETLDHNMTITSNLCKESDLESDSVVKYLLPSPPKKMCTSYTNCSFSPSQKFSEEHDQGSLEDWRTEISKQITSVSKDVKEINSNLNVLLSVSDGVLKSEIKKEFPSPKKLQFLALTTGTKINSPAGEFSFKDCVDINKVKLKIDSESNSEQIYDQSDVLFDKDAEYARMLQEEFDREDKVLKKRIKERQTRRNTRSSLQTESIQSQNTQSSDCKVDSSTKQQHGSNCIEPVDTSKDEEFAHQLAEELKFEEINLTSKTKMQNRNVDTSNDEVIARHLTEELQSEGGNSTRQAFDDEIFAKRLQQIEDTAGKKEKQAMIEKDELLARKMSEIESTPSHGSSELSKLSARKRHASMETYEQEPKLKLLRRTPIGGPASVESIWSKKLHFVHGKAKQKSVDQLAAIRKEQNDRFKSMRVPLTSSSIFTPTSALSPRKQDSENKPRQRSLFKDFSDFGEDSDVHITLDDDGYITHSSDHPQFRSQTAPVHKLPNVTHNSPNTSWGNGSSYSSSTSHSGSSQLESQFSSDNSLWTDSKDLIPSSSKTMKSKCGNCGEIGHTRIDKACPRYYSQEESARRKEKQEKAKQRTEEKAQLEQQTRDELAHHQNVLEDIAQRIQEEKNGLTKTLKKMDKKAKQRDKRRK